MISEITLAMVNNIGLNGISKVIHSYPTQAEAIKKSRRCLPSHIINPSVSSNTQITEQVDLKVRDLESKKNKPSTGLEPVTFRLQVECSTN